MNSATCPKTLLAGDRAFFSGKDDQDAVAFYKAELLPGDGPAPMTGRLDRTNPHNPVRDWSMLFVPYCTGDVDSGSNVPQPAERWPSPGRKQYCRNEISLRWRLRCMAMLGVIAARLM